MGSETKNGCAGEDQQQITALFVLALLYPLRAFISFPHF
jgi:hypothetical protein